MPTTTICAPKPSDKALKVLVGLLGTQDVTFMDDPECKVLVEAVHPLTEDSVTKKTITGWPACVKYLSEHSILWDTENAKAEEAWIQEAASALLGDTSIPDLDSMTPQDFCAKIEDTLKGYYGTDQTYLVGDFPSVADLCCAIWLEQHKDAAGLMGKETKAWLEMIMANTQLNALLKSDMYFD